MGDCEDFAWRKLLRLATSQRIETGSQSLVLHAFVAYAPAVDRGLNRRHGVRPPGSTVAIALANPAIGWVPGSECDPTAAAGSAPHDAGRPDHPTRIAHFPIRRIRRTR